LELKAVMQDDSGRVKRIREVLFDGEMTAPSPAVKEDASSSRPKKSRHSKEKEIGKYLIWSRYSTSVIFISFFDFERRLIAFVETAITM